MTQNKPITCMVCGKETKPYAGGRYPKTCSKECLSVIRAKNGTRNNQLKRGWGTYNERLLNRQKDYIEGILKENKNALACD